MLTLSETRDQWPFPWARRVHPLQSRQMSFGAFLLRVLLCLGLLVNGSAQAMAVTHSVLASHQVRVATPPCHGAEETTAARSQAHEHRAAPATKQPDCCKSGACDCACSHGAVETMPILHAQGRRVRHAALVGLSVTRYASPALPRLIRPPIV